MGVKRTKRKKVGKGKQKIHRHRKVAPPKPARAATEATQTAPAEEATREEAN